MRRRVTDRVFLGLILALLLVGSVVFVSASLGMHLKGDATFERMMLSHFTWLALGLVALMIASNLRYSLWKQYSFYIFIGTLVLTALVYIPGVGFEHGGARRWIDLGIISGQPAELLKLGFIFYFAAFLASLRNKIHSWKNGLLPVMIIIAIPAILLIGQPDTGTLFVISATAFVMYIAAGANWKHVFTFIFSALVAFALLIAVKPYIMDRIITFLDPSRDALGSGYQVQQSLIAIGSGEVFGRGFGQSVQKFNYLPEAIGDSIFAVAAEEFGFIGSLVIIMLFLLFAFRGLHIAKHAPNHFSGLLALGIVILVVVQSFVNIASMIGVFPLTGMPLLFFSHGGTALFVTLFAMGIVLNISKYRKITV